MTTTIEINTVTNETTVRQWTEEEIEARKQYLTPSAWASLRSERNALLAASDARVLPDRWASYSPAKQLEWSEYRQALRDLPENTSDPFNPVWPLQPA